MSSQRLLIAIFLLMVGSGCAAPPRPVASLATPLFTPTFARPTATFPATITAAPPTSVSPTATPTATAVSPSPSTQRPFSITLQTGKSPVDVKGLLYLPQDYGRDAQRRWPLIVFMHGSGQRGYDPLRVASTGLPRVLQERSDLPFVAVSPQLLPGQDWNDKGDEINALIDWLEARYQIDPQRIYLTGFSLGGFGTWALGLRSPNRFAALVPVAGGWVSGSQAVPSNICNLASKPIWVFHGEQDTSVRPAQAEVLVKALRACGSAVRYTLLPKATHADSGILPYRDSELYDWLLQQSLTPADPVGPATPAVISTPLPGDGSLKPVGQHAYQTDLNVVNVNGITRTAAISYLLYLPASYGQDPQQHWPVVLFLHGSDVWGDNPELLTASGLPQRLANTTDFPAIVLSPQAPEDVVWWDTELDIVSALLDHVQDAYAVDDKRIYVTGLSMGGFGAWALAVREPQRFAALVPVAGGWDSQRDSVPRNICNIKALPIWVFHGEQDDIVLPEKAQLMVDALKKCGGDVRFTLYPDANHRQSFERAYADSELYTWLFAQHLP